MKKSFISLLFLLPLASHAYLEAPKQNTKPAVWLTFDACGGDFDWKMAKTLVDNRIKSSVFVTSLWIHKNPQAVTYLKNHPDVFKVENHGQSHHAAVLTDSSIFKVPSVKTLQGLEQEVFTAQSDIENIFGYSPRWFRGATALYDSQSLWWFKQKNMALAGYTISVDLGATASEKQMMENFKKAKNGDILLMHINKPQSLNSQALEKSVEQIKKLNIDWS